MGKGDGAVPSNKRLFGAAVEGDGLLSGVSVCMALQQLMNGSLFETSCAMS